MDKLVLGGFGILIVIGSVATSVIKDPNLAGVVAGFGYVVFILIIFLTDQLMRVEASPYPHIKGLMYKMDSGMLILRSLFIKDAIKIGNGDLDPTGDYPFGWKLLLPYPILLPGFGKVEYVYALTKREPFHENFNFLPTEEAIASWKGFYVRSGQSDGAFTYIDPMPKFDFARPYPVLLFVKTGFDALEYAKHFRVYREITADTFETVRKQFTEDVAEKEARALKEAPQPIAK